MLKKINRILSYVMLAIQMSLLLLGCWMVCQESGITVAIGFLIIVLNAASGALTVLEIYEE